MTKEQILREIRRVAESEGQSPGRRRFEKLTGIGESAWFGKYWARWGDAIFEAGFERNEKQAPLDLAEIIDAYLALVKELGRVPTAGELRLKSKTDGKFHSHSTFRNRLGPKSELLAKVIAHAKEVGESADLILLLQNDLAELSKATKSDYEIDVSVADVQAGFVYLMKSGRYYKIGKTNSLDRRRYEIGLQLPEGVDPIHSIETDDPSGIEAYWHNRFKAKRLNGEWFDLSPVDVRAFRRRKFM